VNLNAMRRWIVFFAALVLGMFLSEVSEAQAERAPITKVINAV
jgi:hypothetical protein